MAKTSNQQFALKHGIREPLLKEAHRLLGEEELRAIAARFERDALELIEHTERGTKEFYRVISPASAMGLVAEALCDPRLHERSIRIYSPEPNELQSLNIAKHDLECGDAKGALRWLQASYSHLPGSRRVVARGRSNGFDEFDPVGTEHSRLKLRVRRIARA